MNSGQQAIEKAQMLTDNVLTPMKRAFVGKDEIIDLLAVSLVGRENLFLMGPPGTAKSALVNHLAARIQGKSFDYLLTRFTEPNELFGPFDIRKLREGELITNKEGMLPEADLIFLDELLNANSAVLNSLLMALNERIFRRGRETIQMPMLMVVGASNQLPEDEALRALFDRFLLRVVCDNVPQEQLQDVIAAGWTLEQQRAESNGHANSDHANETVSVDDIRLIQSAVNQVDVSTVRQPYVELVQRLRHAGVTVSDRRAVKFQRLLAASALLCGRMVANPSDLWILRYTWETEEQQEVLATLVSEAINRASGEVNDSPHPRSKSNHAPDAEALALDLDRIERRLEQELGATDLSYVQDQLSVLSGRCEWVDSEQTKTFLKDRLKIIWDRLM
ncbi:AAA family ATPase [Thalassoglobus polymorphus]|uniref:ATPase RavA n=1 Tax=Thalassoglobus polymorphus TaxID=2527994 RepID=A0A517QKK0_9PLAN|nr:AAA family ATPase [Thalassoglobus polymorphus]QDT32155.1 ATPase RavA [Thalassoglobus polymorphus]